MILNDKNVLFIYSLCILSEENQLFEPEVLFWNGQVLYVIIIQPSNVLSIVPSFRSKYQMQWEGSEIQILCNSACTGNIFG